MKRCDFKIQKERGREYTVWSVSPYTGSKQDVVARVGSKREARSTIRRLQKKAGC